jgi:5,10-methylenetetrahydromethanopterin reductase
MTSPTLALQLSNHAGVNRSIELAVAAEQAGLEAIWIAEDLYYYGAIPLAAAILSRTSRINVGFGVLTPYGRHPALLAMDIATLQELAAGRLILGLGAGVRARIEHMGFDWHNPVDTVREIADTTSRLLRGEQLDHDGPLVQATSLALSMEDPTGDPVIYVAAMGPKALQQAGRLYQGVLFSSMISRAELRRSTGLVAAGAAQAGRPTPRMVASVPLRIAGDHESALASVKRGISATIVRWSKVPALARVFLDTLSEADLQAMVARLEQGDDPAEVIDDGFCLDYTFAGTMSDVIAQVTSLTEVTGVTSVAVAVDPNADVAKIREQLTALSAALRAA